MNLHSIYIAFFLLFVPLLSTANDGIWLLVDTQKLELDVKLAETTLVRFENIAIGRNGSGFKKKRGDDTTPLGKYKISWINRKSQYKYFYGFNYPSRENVYQAFTEGLVDKQTYQRVMKAHKHHQVPPQNTPLGGMIGIHGLGGADRKIHESMNWTHGCIALSNEQIRRLDTWIKKDTIVVVK